MSKGWTLDQITEIMAGPGFEFAVDWRSATWWLIRRIIDLERQIIKVANMLPRAEQRMLDVQGVELHASKGKITSQETGAIRKSRRLGRRPSHGRRGPFSPVGPD